MKPSKPHSSFRMLVSVCGFAQPGTPLIALNEHIAVSAPAPTPAPTPALDAVGRGPSLAVGITEPNPSLVAAPLTRSVPPEFARWRDALAGIHPAVYRLVVPWSSVQPRPAGAPNPALLNGGCMRAIPPRA